MTEQQYTCPFCFKDYTQFTIHEHYGCGVEPFETVEDIKAEPDSISEEMEEQKEGKSFYGVPTSPAVIEESKPEPKKRGRKPKSVA